MEWDWLLNILTFIWDANRGNAYNNPPGSVVHHLGASFELAGVYCEPAETKRQIYVSEALASIYAAVP